MPREEIPVVRFCGVVIVAVYVPVRAETLQQIDSGSGPRACLGVVLAFEPGRFVRGGGEATEGFVARL